MGLARADEEERGSWENRRDAAAGQTSPGGRLGNRNPRDWMKTERRKRE
jgi:hypothetical protein